MIVLVPTASTDINHPFESKYAHIPIHIALNLMADESNGRMGELQVQVALAMSALALHQCPRRLSSQVRTHAY